MGTRAFREGALGFGIIYRVAYGTKVEIKINPYSENPSVETVIQTVDYIVDGKVEALGKTGWLQVKDKPILTIRANYSCYLTKLGTHADGFPKVLNVNGFGQDNSGNTVHQQILVSYLTHLKNYNVVIK